MSNTKITLPADVYWENLDLQANQVNSRDFIEVEIPQTWYDSNKDDIGEHYPITDNGDNTFLIDCN